MTTQGVDYMSTQDAARVAALKASGLGFVCRYYDGSGGTSAKCLDAAEAQALIAAGLQIFTVFETAPTDVAYFSRARGRSDGDAARTAAQAAGQPARFPIFFAVDYDASDADLVGPITEYFNGVNERLAGAYPIGVYGSFRVCQFAKAHWPAVPRLWQTYAWSGGQKADGLDLYQYQNDLQIGGVSVDRDEAYVAGWGPAEEDVTEDQVKQILKDYLANVYGPALEAELRQLKHDTVAEAVKAVGAKLDA